MKIYKHITIVDLVALVTIFSILFLYFLFQIKNELKSDPILASAEELKNDVLNCKSKNILNGALYKKKVNFSNCDEVKKELETFGLELNVEKMIEYGYLDENELDNYYKKNKSLISVSIYNENNEVKFVLNKNPFSKYKKSLSYNIIYNVMNPISDNSSVLKNIDIDKNELYVEKINNQKNFIFKGNVIDNYVAFNNLLFRIVSVDSYGKVKLVFNDFVDIKSNYEDIFYNLNEWLEKSLNKESFKKRIVNHTWCLNDLCVENKVGLLTEEEDKIVQSYLKKDYEYWKLNSKPNLTEAYIKPVIILDEIVEIEDGNGTLDDPYIVK